MSIPLGQPAATGIQRGRGGFLRSADDKPYVSDPTGATVNHDGNKPDLINLCNERGIPVPAKVTVAQLHELLGGRPKRIAYGSPSNRGKRIENTTNLVKWGERRVVLGVGLDTEITTACQHLATLEVDSDEYKTCADGIIVRAKEVAKANLAAQRGTHVHALTEDFDESRDWVLRAEAGEIVGLDRELQDSLVAGWHRMLKRHELEVLAVEASCVDDIWRLAGILDRILRLGTQLRFRLVTGQIIEIPAATVVVGDVKTSNMRLDRNGCVQYWQAFAIQIASYAQSVPYDTETEVRGEWPWPIDQTHALILHPNIDTCEWELIYVDLVAGREHGGRCVVDADSWEARTDIFSVAQLDVPVDSELGNDSDHHRMDSESTGATDSPQPEAVLTAGEGPVDDPSPAISDTCSCDGCFTCTGHQPGCSCDQDPNVPVEVAPIASTGTTNSPAAPDPAVAATAGEPAGRRSPANLDDDDFDAPMVPTVAPGQDRPASPARAESLQWLKPAAVPPPELTIDRDEGSFVHLDGAFNELEAEYAKLDPVPKAWLVGLSQQAMHADVSFHSSGHRTERRWWLIKGLVALGISQFAEDEVLRALVALAMESDAPLYTAIKPGHAVGALGAERAQRFSNLVDDLNLGRLEGLIDDSGTFVLRPIVAAA